MHDSSHSPSSSLHSKILPVSFEVNSKVASSEPDKDEGPESIVVFGSVVSMVNEYESGSLIFPARSVALTSKTYAPS